LSVRLHGDVSNEPLPSKCRGIYGHGDWWEGFIKYAFEMVSCAICSKFYKEGFRHSKVDGRGGDSQTTYSLLFSFLFKIREVD
jgi:hypothetical protein